jgi:hypothetical protein
VAYKKMNHDNQEEQNLAEMLPVIIKTGAYSLIYSTTSTMLALWIVKTACQVLKSDLKISFN